MVAGTPSGTGVPSTALVTDTSGMSSGALLELQHIDCATVIGAVRVTGGDGAQTVWGDGESQTILLGADDDVLHGGAGNDTVDSESGNDEVFGDEGNDLVFGGFGNDTIDGGSGADIVQLADSGRADYSMRVVNGKLMLTHRDGARTARIRCRTSGACSLPVWRLMSQRRVRSDVCTKLS